MYYLNNTPFFEKPNNEKRAGKLYYDVIKNPMWFNESELLFLFVLNSYLYFRIIIVKHNTYSYMHTTHFKLFASQKKNFQRGIQFSS